MSGEAFSGSYLKSRSSICALKRKAFPLVARRELAKAIEAHPRADRVTVTEGPALVVQVKAARQGVARDALRLRKAEKMVVSDPEIMQGTPVYRGTRIPGELIAEMLAQGTSAHEIIAGYPALTRTRLSWRRYIYARSLVVADPFNGPGPRAAS